MSVSLNTHIFPTFRAANTPPEPKNNIETKNSSTSTTTKVLVGSGLAALAAVGIYIATRGRSTKQATQEMKNLYDVLKSGDIKTETVEKLSYEDIFKWVKNIYQKNPDAIKQCKNPELSIMQLSGQLKPEELKNLNLSEKAILVNLIGDEELLETKLFNAENLSEGLLDLLPKDVTKVLTQKITK